MQALLENLALLIAEPHAWIAIAIAAITGVVRGFAGFGTGMIFMPPIAALYGPRMAVIALWIMDSLPSLPIVIPALKHVQWRTIFPLAGAYAITVHLGVALLMHGDPMMLRWLLSATVFGFLILLWSGWQYHGPRPAWLSAGVGGIAGIFGGAAQLPAPPVLVYWMASNEPARTIRANIIAFMAITEIFVGIAFFIASAFTAKAIALGILVAPVYMLGLVFGQHNFNAASDESYRRIAFMVIAVSAIVGLPIFDDLLTK